MSKTKSKKRKSVAELITGRDAASVLQRSVIKWLEHENCPPMVIGPVSIIQMPEDREFNFYVAVRITGKKPVKP